MRLHCVAQESGVVAWKNGGWCLIVCPADDKLDDETFSIAEMVISLIAKSGQDSNVDVVLNEKES